MGVRITASRVVQGYHDDGSENEEHSNTTTGSGNPFLGSGREREREREIGQQCRQYMHARRETHTCTTWSSISFLDPNSRIKMHFAQDLSLAFRAWAHFPAS